MGLTDHMTELMETMTVANSTNPETALEVADEIILDGVPFAGPRTIEGLDSTYDAMLRALMTGDCGLMPGHRSGRWSSGYCWPGWSVIARHTFSAPTEPGGEMVPRDHDRRRSTV
jgi:hypothetical protein